MDHTIFVKAYPVSDIPPTVYVNYQLITLTFKNMVIYPSVWRIMNDSRYPNFYNKYIYTLNYIICLGEPSGNIISNYHDTFIHISMNGYDPNLKIHILNRFFVNVAVLIFQCIFFITNVTFFLELVSLKFPSCCLP